MLPEDSEGLNAAAAKSVSLPVGTIEELIRRLEQATGPNYALEREIARAVGWPDDMRAPTYTCSLDAALTLVPDEWFFHMARYSVGHDPRCDAHVYSQRPYEHFEAQGPTVQLALCIAALKARLSTGTAPRATPEAPSEPAPTGAQHP